VRVNLGSGLAYMPGWVNVDESPDVKADIHLDAVDFVRQYGDQVEEVYMGHVLEHILPGDALTLLKLLYERLPAGAVVSAVTPDMDQIWSAYRAGEIDNDMLNASFIYSYVQPSHHVWCYDQRSLTELFRRAGFSDVTPIDPLTWDPVYHKSGPESRWQCGVKATAGGAPAPDLGAPPAVRRLTFDELFGAQTEAAQTEAAQTEAARTEIARAGGDTDRTPTQQELLLRRIEVLREGLGRELRTRAELQEQIEDLRRREQEAAEAAAEARAEADRAGGAGAVPRPRAAVDDDTAEPTDAGPSVVPVAPRHPVRPPSLPGAPASRRTRIKEYAKATLPPGSRRRELAKAALLSYRDAVRAGQNMRSHLRAARRLTATSEPPYGAWLRGHRVAEAELTEQRAYARALADPAVLHVVVLPGDGLLQRTLRSLSAQSWPHWRATVCGDARGPARDDRVSALPAPDGPAHGANEAVRAVESDLVVVLRPGDVLEPDCFYRVATAVRQDPLVDLVSWDDDQIDAEDRRAEPRFRPVGWSPEVLVSGNYLGRAFALRRRRYLVCGGLREQGSAMFWDLLLRAGLTAERVTHVPRVLGSVTDRVEAAGEDGVRVVQQHLERLDWPGSAESAGDAVRVRWRLPDPPHVSVIIPTKHNRPMLATCLPSLAATDYPSFDVVIVDNGGQSAANERWYDDHRDGLDLNVLWWTEPFNYSRVNNAGAAQARGEVLVFLNDDTELADPGWLTELVGWATRPDIGSVGLQLRGPDGRIQHGGVVVGLNGFADHLFEDMRPGEDTIFGPTTWYRNTSAVTGACVAVRREVFDEVGGLDERFVLCGSDVVFGLGMLRRRLRNVCSPFALVRHLESATRGTSVPRMDYFTSYWQYSPALFGGDPYFSPNLSLSSRRPALRAADEPTPGQRIGPILDRSFEVYRQTNDEAEARAMAEACRAMPVDEQATIALHAANAEPFAVRSVNWFIPGIDSPFYGGINTALRIADKLARDHGVQNRFVVSTEPNEGFIRSGLAAAFPALADADITFFRQGNTASLEQVPYADVSVATLWTTAYPLTHFPHTKRKFYLIQDYEPIFYPAGTNYALAEETYRLGLYGLCNTDNLLTVYRDEYGGRGMSFMPAVDQSVFHARWRHDRTPDSPATIFVYGRPGHWRNCWELAAPALEEVKRRLGNSVRIVTAGSWAVGGGGEADMRRLGLLDYRATGELYRHCDVGLALTVSRHPSYLPLELMACGVPVVAFDNPWGHWILRDGENCLLSKRTVDSLADRLERLAVDRELRLKLAKQGLADIAAGHADWDAALSGVYGFLCDPEGTS
jgi:O-antigen biosynthesis protein